MATSFLVSIPTIGNEAAFWARMASTRAHRWWECWSPRLLCHILSVWADEVCESMCVDQRQAPKYGCPVNHQPSWLPNQLLIYESQSSSSIFNLTAEMAKLALQHKAIRNELILQGWIIFRRYIVEKSHSSRDVEVRVCARGRGVSCKLS